MISQNAAAFSSENQSNWIKARIIYRLNPKSLLLHRRYNWTFMENLPNRLEINYSYKLFYSIIVELFPRMEINLN